MKRLGVSTSKQSGFTLIELSVVLVIIGLIIGAIMFGQHLIRAAELRSIASDKEKLVTAVYSFRTKYNAIPGDMRDAQSIWGAAASCAADQTTEATCNGNGDGKININTPSGTRGNEGFLLWKHLANAGLIEGSYTGLHANTDLSCARDYNAPSGKISGSLWYLEDLGTVSSAFWAWSNTFYGNMLELGMPQPNDDPWGNVLTAAEAYALDSKIDDGKPGTGILFGDRSLTECVVRADGVTAAGGGHKTTAIYKTSSTGLQCYLVFVDVF
jgi:prepilin-type N-terminal cleavage/methylation domain-containing protein